MTVLPGCGVNVVPSSIEVGKEEKPPSVPPQRSTIGPESDWIDRFMEKISQREYDAAREVLRRAVAQGAGKSVAEQYAKVLEDFLQQRDDVEKPQSDIACFGACAVREMDNATGRGLIVPGYTNWNDELWRQRPVAYIQSPPSRKSAQVCHACLVPVGTLASQLTYLGLPVPEGAENVEVVEGAGSSYQCPGGCGEVFCGEACCEWSRQSSSHALLCRGCLSSEGWAALQALDQLAVETDQEHLLLLAHHVAVALLRRLAGDELSDVMQRYVKQFFTSPWDSLADEAIADDTPCIRRNRLEQAAGHLQRIFAGHELAAPFLNMDVLSSMMGTYELVNMCISIPHPLNANKRVVELIQSAALAKLHELQKGVDEDSDEEDEDEEEDDEADAEEVDAKAEAPGKEDINIDNDADREAAALRAAAAGTLFAHVVGTSLCEALSYTNHSCLPNANIDFATSATLDNKNGPGLWVFSTARRPMLPGDEVQMCYVPSVIGKPVEIRQKRMKRFGFECRCRCCTTDLMLKAEGDVVIPL